MPAWKAQIGRATLFPAASGTAPPSALEFYKQLWKADPDSFQKQGPGAPLTASFAQGTISGLSLSCSVNPARIDCTIGPVVTTGPTEPAGPYLIEDLNSFQTALQNLIESCSGLDLIAVRGGCFAQFAIPAKTHREANANLISKLPHNLRVALTDEEDFSLQINQPASEHGGVFMNYLTKWSVDRVQVLNLQLGVGVNQLVEERLTSVIAFDNNNRPSAPLSKEQLSTVLHQALDRIRSGVRESEIQ